MEEEIKQLKSIIDFAPPFLSNIKPSDWAEKNRVMGRDTSPFPGKFSYDKTPYLREVADCLSPDHEARVVAVMKGAQLGFSTGVIENGIGWIIDQNPGNILLAARDEALVKKMMNSKVDTMIDGCNIRHLIRPNVIRKKKQRTGDTDLSKEFAGGSLMAVSIQKPERSRQVSMQYGFLDDFEAAPESRAAGNAAKLYETRFRAFLHKMKLFYISTPEIQQTSNIEPLYLQGDRRKYMIPCPCCGDYINLEWSLVLPDFKAGITWKLDKSGNVDPKSVGYICQSCGGFFDDRKKTDFNNNGYWEATADPQEKGFYSYHLSSLYAPVGMFDWYRYVKDYHDACPPDGKIDKGLYKTFVNTVLGETWVDLGKENDAKGIIKNTREYQVNTIPCNQSVEDGNGDIWMITCGADMNGLTDDARLDYEIVAWSSNGSSYSISHGSIGTFVSRQGKKLSDEREKLSYDLYASNSVWFAFTEILSKGYETDDGRVLNITATALDTGQFTQMAYNYINESDLSIFGVKGWSGKRSNTQIDTKIFKKGTTHPKLWILEVNKIKDMVSENMLMRWNGETQEPHFMNFPEPSDGLYTLPSFFKHFEAEKRVSDGKNGMTWIKKNTAVQNHFFDCRVYNIAIKEIISYLVCQESGIKDYSYEKYVQLLMNN